MTRVFCQSTEKAATPSITWVRGMSWLPEVYAWAFRLAWLLTPAAQREPSSFNAIQPQPVHWACLTPSSSFRGWLERIFSPCSPVRFSQVPQPHRVPSVLRATMHRSLPLA